MAGRFVRFGGEMRGLERAKRQMSDYQAGMIEGIVEAQQRVAEDVLERSYVYVPVDTGDLRSTGHVTEPRGFVGRHTSFVEVTIEYGGPAAPYAGYVHEILGNFHAPPTQAKYLQRAVDELAPSMPVTIAEGAVTAAKRKAGR